MTIRQQLAEACSRTLRDAAPEQHDYDYADSLLRRVAAEGAAKVADDLDRGAWRREVLHDDPCSADQMHACATALRGWSE